MILLKPGSGDATAWPAASQSLYLNLIAFSVAGAVPSYPGTTAITWKVGACERFTVAVRAKTAAAIQCLDVLKAAAAAPLAVCPEQQRVGCRLFARLMG